MSNEGSKQSKGGSPRAVRLDAETRKRIATEGGTRPRYGGSIFPKVDYSGVLEIGGAPLPCAVLSDGRRVLSENGITYAILGERSGASKGLERADITGSWGSYALIYRLKPVKAIYRQRFISGPPPADRISGCRRTVIGYDPRILRAVCEIWLRAREAGALQKQQLDKAQRAEIFIRALADVGIIALVDEATGFQVERAGDALHQLTFHLFVEERLAWAKRLSLTNFTKQVYRLNGWPWPVGKAKTPYLGHITNDVVYDRYGKVLDPNCWEMTTTQDPTQRRFKHHRFLSKEIGQPDLRDHILQILPIMRILKDWKSFKRQADVAFPRNGGQIAMDLGEDG